MASAGHPTRVAKPSRVLLEFWASSPQAHIGATKLMIIRDSATFANLTSKTPVQDGGTPKYLR
jgi:hypothetical protein